MMNKARFWLKLSLFANILLLLSIGFMLRRLGGWKYALYKFRNDEAGLYTHRKQLFNLLPPPAAYIVFLGDSQTQEAEWREIFGDSLPILNRGIVGDHVEGVWQRLDDVLKNKPSKLFLCIGINDLLLGKPLADIQKRYVDIVKKIRHDQPNTQLILQTVLPINNQVKQIGIDNDLVRALNAGIAQIAKDFALPLVDIYTPLADAHNDLATIYTDDGLHLNGQGYMVWKKALAPFIF